MLDADLSRRAYQVSRELVKLSAGHPDAVVRTTASALSSAVSWMPCGCAGGLGHLRVSCRTDGCTSPEWYRPRHREGAEVTGRPGGAAMQQ